MRSNRDTQDWYEAQPGRICSGIRAMIRKNNHSWFPLFGGTMHELWKTPYISCTGHKEKKLPYNIAD